MGSAAPSHMSLENVFMDVWELGLTARSELEAMLWDWVPFARSAISASSVRIK